MTTKSAFETMINNRVVSEVTLPKVTFGTKEVYDQVKHLSHKIPFWTSEHNNPINQFIPTQEMAFKPREDPTKAIAD